MAHEILVSAQGPLVLGFWVWGLGIWGLGLTMGRFEVEIVKLRVKRETSKLDPEIVSVMG